MPERLSLATVATCAVLAGAGFGGAYALAHGRSAEPAPAPASPTAIRLKHAPIGELRRVSPLPSLIVPPPRTVPDESVPVVADLPPVVTTAEPAPLPAPTPTPTPKPPAPTKKPLTFDDSG